MDYEITTYNACCMQTCNDSIIYNILNNQPSILFYL